MLNYFKPELARSLFFKSISSTEVLTISSSRSSKSFPSVIIFFSLIAPYLRGYISLKSDSSSGKSGEDEFVMNQKSLKKLFLILVLNFICKLMNKTHIRIRKAGRTISLRSSSKFKVFVLEPNSRLAQND